MADHEKYIGKTFGEDFTRREIEADFSEHEVFISKLGSLAIANFRPDRLRVWLDENNKVVKIVEG